MSQSTCPMCHYSPGPSDEFRMTFNELMGHGYVFHHLRNGKTWCGIAGFVRKENKFVRTSPAHVITIELEFLTGPVIEQDHTGSVTEMA